MRNRRRREITTKREAVAAREAPAREESLSEGNHPQRKPSTKESTTVDEVLIKGDQFMAFWVLDFIFASSCGGTEMGRKEG